MDFFIRKKDVKELEGIVLSDKQVRSIQRTAQECLHQFGRFSNVPVSFGRNAVPQWFHTGVNGGQYYFPYYEQEKQKTKGVLYSSSSGYTSPQEDQIFSALSQTIMRQLR